MSGPVHRGTHAQRVIVRRDKAGGAWFDVGVDAARRYRQSVYLALPKLAKGARVEMIVEWYDANARLLDYRVRTFTSKSKKLIRRVQTVIAPPEANMARWVMNIRGGGTLVMDDAAFTAQ